MNIHICLISLHLIICFLTPHNFYFIHHVFFSQINLPVLPAGLQIMADQGFQNAHPILVLPRYNQPAIQPDMRRYNYSKIFYSNLI